MSLDSLKITDSQKYLTLGWFHLPIEPEENFSAIRILVDILLVTSVVPNIILLWVIWKNPDKKPRSDKDFLLANLSIVNSCAALFVLVGMIESRTKLSNTITYKVQAILVSIILPKYYSCVFLLTLTQYAVIVKPLKFKLIDPRNVKTTKAFLLILWIVTSAVLIITPIFYEDFHEYIKVMVMVIVCLSWITTLWITYMYIRIIHKLWKRRKDLKEKFNLSKTRQGTIAIRQNNRLAKVLLFFIVTLVLFSLPSNTAYLFFLYCSQCSQRTLVKACLYTLPLFLTLPSIHPIHWLVGTPSYYKELKKQAKKILVLVLCRRKENQEIGRQYTFCTTNNAFVVKATAEQ